MPTKRDCICVFTMAIALVVANILYISSTNSSRDRSEFLHIKPKSYLKRLQNDLKQHNNDSVERSKLDVNSKSDLKSLQNSSKQHNSDNVEGSKLDVQPKLDPKSLQNSSKQHNNDNVERAKLDVKPKSDPKSLQNSSKQHNSDNVELSKLDVKPRLDLNNPKNPPKQHNNDNVERSKLDVKPKSDLKNPQNKSKENNGEKVVNKISQKRPLGTAKKEVSKKPGPLYSDPVITPYPFKLIRNPVGCRSVSSPNGNVFLLILVACRHSEVEDRSLIRKTWGKVKVHKGKSILVRFLVGLPHTLRENNKTEEEIAEYGDIIQGDYVDSYRNMTLKVLMGLKWAGLMCPNATYVMNLDSDMFVNVYNLVTLLENSPRVKFAKGNLKIGTSPLRNRHMKWYTPVEMYPESRYPPYLNGPAYVMSGDLPGLIFNESLHVRYIPWDDVFIGLVMKRIKVTPLRGSHFEDYPNLKSTRGVLNAIGIGVATHVGHQGKSNPVFLEIWTNISRTITH